MRLDIGFVNDTNQAESLISANIKLFQVFSFCPAAAYVLKKSGYSVATPSSTYKAMSQGKNAVYSTKRTAKLVEDATRIYKLKPGESEGLASYLKHYLPVVYYNYYSVLHYSGQALAFQIVENGKLKKEDNFRKVLESLISWTITKFNSYENTKYSSFNNALCKLNNKFVRALHAKNKFRVAHFGNSTQFKKMLNAIEDKRPVAHIFTRKMPRSSGQALKFLLANLKKILFGNKNNKPIFYFRTTAPANYIPFDATNQLKDAVKSIFHEVDLQKIVADEIARYIPFLKTQYEIGQQFVDEIKPDLLLTDHVIYNFIRGAFDKAHEKKLPAMIINQGTHTKQEQRLSKVAGNLWASTGRVVTASATHYASKMPLTHELAKELEPQLPRNFLKIAPYPHLKLDISEPAKNFTILVAGNYSWPDFHMPRITETPEEFLLGLMEIIEELGQLENIEVIIKLKIKKAPVHAQILNDKINELGLSHKVYIDTNTKFPEVLARSHLVISNLSAALEEALAAPVPLMLYSYRKKYFHLPCSFDATPSFVYGVKKREHLQGIVQSIRQNYKEITENKPGLDKIVWKDSEVTDILALAKQLG